MSNQPGPDQCYLNGHSSARPQVDTVVGEVVFIYPIRSPDYYNYIYGRGEAVAEGPIHYSVNG